MLLSTHFTTKTFSLTINRKTLGSSKNGTRDFKDSPPFTRSVLFLCDNHWKFWTFQYFNFETNFLKNKNLFWKTGLPFLVESTDFESVTFPYKTDLSKANINPLVPGGNKKVTHAFTNLQLKAAGLFDPCMHNVVKWLNIL